MKVDERKTTKCLVAVIFVLVEMMFIVSAITEKASARTTAYVFPSHAVPPGGYSNLRAHLDAGKFVYGPTINHLGWIIWETTGKFPSVSYLLC